MIKRIAFLLLAVLFVIPLAQAQTWPAKPLRIIVPFGAGGVADLTVRTVAQQLSQSLGQAVVIDNRPGAGGVVAADLVAKAEPDGYTLLLMSNGSAVSASLFKTLPYDTVRDFAMVSTLGYFDLAIVASADSRFTTLGELLTFARANPGKLNLGSINIGSTQNLAAELFKSSAGVDLQVVPFNGTPAVITALRGKQIDAAVEILGPVMPQLQSRALRALAVAGERRNPALPDVPTARESGLASYVASSWNALAVPARTPAAVVSRLNQDLVAALNSPDMKKRLQDLNVQARSSTPAEAGELLRTEVKRWGDVITRANIPRQ
jgi:tripartite-type tricarboxylate transporter receptor subunit TctC